jgi:hypothetical protein
MDAFLVKAGLIGMAILVSAALLKLGIVLSLFLAGNTDQSIQV